MKPFLRFGAIAAAVVLVALVLTRTRSVRMSSSVSLQPPHYLLQRIPERPKRFFFARYLTDEGHVLGATGPRNGDPIENAFSAKAAVWDGQRFREIPDASGISARGMNNRGELLLGSKELFQAGAAVWSHGKATPVPLSMPVAMNNRGQVIGYLVAADARRLTPCLWSGGKLTDISFGNRDIKLKSMNDSGQIVGVSFQRLPTRASSRKAQHTEDLLAGNSRGTVYLLNPGSERWVPTNLLANVSVPLDPDVGVDELKINNKGQILCSLFFETGKNFVWRAAVWDQGRVREIGTKELNVSATWMNDAGQVVGTMSRVSQCGWTPFIWQDGALYDLSSLLVGKPGIRIKEVRCINNEGWILCEGEKGDQPYTAILRPVNPSRVNGIGQMSQSAAPLTRYGYSPFAAHTLKARSGLQGRSVPAALPFDRSLESR
jgi:hypothetical protein